MCSRLDTPKSRLTLWDRSKSQHNDPTVIKHCQNVRLTSAKLLVKFQLDCCKIKANSPEHVFMALDQPDSRCFGMDKKLLALMVLAFLLMIRQSSNFVRICASPLQNGT